MLNISLLVPVLKKYNVPKAGLFGSYSRGDQTESSDVDIVIEPPKDMTYFTFFDLKEELESTIEKKVDLLTYRGLNPHIKPHIEKEQVIIYDTQ